MQRNGSRMNVVAECRDLHLGLWSCPPFLFVVMGVVNIVAMFFSYLFASRYVEEPQVAALIVIGVAVIFFVIGNFIIHGFTQIAEANRIKSEFIAIVSHQLRSPLSVFKWILSAWEQNTHATLTPRDSESYLEMLRENAEKMIQLVNILLEVSRIEAGRLLLRRDPVHLAAVTENIVRSYAAYARASNVAIDYVAPLDLPPVAGDSEKMRMVIQNLIDNAIRYSFSGGRVEVTLAPAGTEAIEWRIRDHGVGIPKDQQRLIFQKFFRGDHAVKHETQGSGLGLYIAQSVVSALNGEIGFTSEEGRGSTFWFRMPLFRGGRGRNPGGQPAGAASA